MRLIAFLAIVLDGAVVAYEINRAYYGVPFFFCLLGLVAMLYFLAKSGRRR